MKQPIRKNTLETHTEAAPNTYTLLVDGTNLLKICMVDNTVNGRGEHIGGVIQFLSQLKKILQTRVFNFCYVFFDDEYSGVLRYNLYKHYKANRDKDYSNAPINISEYMREVNRKIKNANKYFYSKKKNSEVDDANFIKSRDMLCEYFNELFIRWMIDENTEVDDLIAYYVKHKNNNDKVVILSSDHDLTQLISEDVYLYNPRLKKNITHINFIKEFGYHQSNVVLKKILCGDTSDNISNISGLTDKKLVELIPDINKRQVTLDEVKQCAKALNEDRINNKKPPYKYCDNILNGVSNKTYDGDFYEINEKIINLHNPLLTQDAITELSSMMYAPMDVDDRTFSNLYKLIIRDDITNLIDDKKFSHFFVGFQGLIDNEKKFFKNNLF